MLRMARARITLGGDYKTLESKTPMQLLSTNTLPPTLPTKVGRTEIPIDLNAEMELQHPFSAWDLFAALTRRDAMTNKRLWDRKRSSNLAPFSVSL